MSDLLRAKAARLRSLQSEMYAAIDHGKSQIDEGNLFGDNGAHITYDRFFEIADEIGAIQNEINAMNLPCPEVVVVTATRITNCGGVLEDGVLEVNYEVGTGVVAPARLDLWIRHPSVNGGVDTDVTSSIAVVEGQTGTLTSTVAIPQTGETFEACLRLQPDGTGNFPAETEVFCCDFTSATTTLPDVIFEALRLEIDEAGFVREDYYGAYANETLAPADPSAGTTYTETVTVTSMAQLESEVASTALGHKLINVSTATFANVGDITLQNNGGKVDIKPAGAALSTTITNGRFIVRGAPISFLDMNFSGMNGAGSQGAFNFYTPEHRINGCRIFNTTGIPISVWNGVGGAEGGSYVYITNNDIDTFSGTVCFIQAANLAEQAINRKGPQGFHLLYNDIQNAGGSTNAVVTSEGQDPVDDPAYHVIAGNYIRDALRVGEDEIVSAKTHYWLSFHNLVVDCDNGHFSGRVGPNIYNLGNTILPSAFAQKPIRQLGPDGIEKWLVYRGNEGLLGAGSPVYGPMISGTGIRMAPRIIDSLAGTNPSNQYNSQGSSNGIYSYNLIEGAQSWVSLETTLTSGDVLESYAVDNEGENNIFVEATNPDPLPVQGAAASQAIPYPATQWESDNPLMTWADQIYTSTISNNNYGFPVAKTFDFTPHVITDWDPDSRGLGQTLAIGPGPYWERAVKIFDSNDNQVWGVGV